MMILYSWGKSLFLIECYLKNGISRMTDVSYTGTAIKYMVYGRVENLDRIAKHKEDMDGSLTIRYDLAGIAKRLIYSRNVIYIGVALVAIKTLGITFASLSVAAKLGSLLIAGGTFTYLHTIQRLVPYLIASNEELRA